MKYRLLRERVLEVLEQEVNHLLDDGYWPCGAPIITVDPRGLVTHYQAVWRPHTQRAATDKTPSRPFPTGGMPP